MGKKVSYPNIKVGNQYIYEESLYSEGLDVIIFRAVVSILKDLSSNEYWKYVLRVDKWIGGVCDELPQGYKFESAMTKNKALYSFVNKMGGNSFYSLV